MWEDFTTVLGKYMATLKQCCLLFLLINVYNKNRKQQESYQQTFLSVIHLVFYYFALPETVQQSEIIVSWTTSGKVQINRHMSVCSVKNGTRCRFPLICQQFEIEHHSVNFTIMLFLVIRFRDRNIAIILWRMKYFMQSAALFHRLKRIVNNDIYL